MNDVDLEIVGGLPYSRRIRIKDGKNIWDSLDDLEVRSQIRLSPQRSSALKNTLSSFFTPSFDENDIVLNLHMTGSATKTLNSGFYDVVVSDKGNIDNRAIRVLKGQVRVQSLVTGA